MSEGTALLEKIAAAGFPSLGRSRQGRPIAGRIFPAEGAPDIDIDIDIDHPGARVLLVGGVHGDEPSSVEALLALADELSAKPPRHTAVMVVPVLNPDGVAARRKNTSSDVDLNRNFPARNFTRAHQPGYDPGPFPLSEPESAWLAALLAEQTLDAVVAVHAPFGCVNFDGPARAWAEEVAAACGWPVRENIGYPTPGSLGGWLGVDRGLPILTLELPAGPLAGFRSAAAAALNAAWARAPRANCGEFARSSVNQAKIG